MVVVDTWISLQSGFIWFSPFYFFNNYSTISAQNQNHHPKWEANRTISAIGNWTTKNRTVIVVSIDILIHYTGIDEAFSTRNQYHERNTVIRHVIRSSTKFTQKYLRFSNWSKDLISSRLSFASPEMSQVVVTFVSALLSWITEIRILFFLFLHKLNNITKTQMKSRMARMNPQLIMKPNPNWKQKWSTVCCIIALSFQAHHWFNNSLFVCVIFPFRFYLFHFVSGTIRVLCVFHLNKVLLGVLYMLLFQQIVWKKKIWDT